MDQYVFQVLVLTVCCDQSVVFEGFMCVLCSGKVFLEFVL